MSKQVKGKIKIIPLVILMLLLRSDQKKILTHDTYYSNYFFRQVDFPSFLHLFALILFEKSLQIPKNIEKTKDVSTCKIPISPIHMRQWRKIVPFFPNRPLGLVPVESKRSADFSNGAMRIDGPPVRFLVGRNCCLQPGVYLQTKRKKKFRLRGS